MIIGGNAMFNIGDTIVYSVHGLCKIDDICEKTISDVTKTYYVLHPLGQINLTISIPIDSDKVVMLKTMNRDEAEEILYSFKLPGINWIDDVRQRVMKYNGLIKRGNRQEIARIANTLMRKNYELSVSKRRLYDQDRKLLHSIQTILFKELAMTLNTSVDHINEQINKMIGEKGLLPLSNTQ